MSCTQIQEYARRKTALVDFYESPLGQTIYSKRKISVEPLIEHIKSIFRIDPVPTRGFDMVRGTVPDTRLLQL